MGKINSIIDKSQTVDIGFKLGLSILYSYSIYGLY